MKYASHNPERSLLSRQEVPEAGCGVSGHWGPFNLGAHALVGWPLLLEMGDGSHG